MNDFDLFGKYYQRAEKHVILDLCCGLIFACVVWYFTENWFYGYICACFSYNAMRLLNLKNRQLEILNRLDEIEQQIKDIR